MHGIKIRLCAPHEGEAMKPRYHAVFTAFIFVVTNIIVDILYAVLDPRISVGSKA